MSKKLADGHFQRFFIGKRDLPPPPEPVGGNKARLSLQAVHFCTFYVDKIVSKATHPHQSP